MSICRAQLRNTCDKHFGRYYRLPVRILPVLVALCSWRQRWTDYMSSWNGQS